MTENVEQNLIYVSVYSFSLTIEIFKKKKKSNLRNIIIESLGELREPIDYVAIYLFYPEIFVKNCRLLLLEIQRIRLSSYINE